MKYFLLILLLSCTPQRDLEYESGVAEVIRLKDREDGCKVTWWIQTKQIEVVTFESCPCSNYKLGIKHSVLFPR